MYYVENHDGDYNIDIFGIFSPGWGFLDGHGENAEITSSDLTNIFSQKDSQLLQTRK